MQTKHCAFIADETDQCRVVSLATGHSTVDPRLIDDDGRILKDVHAEVIARRALLK